VEQVERAGAGVVRGLRRGSTHGPTSQPLGSERVASVQPGAFDADAVAGSIHPMSRWKRGKARALARWTRGVGLLALAALAGVLASCAERPESRTYTSLLALADASPTTEAGAVRPLVLEVGGERRSALYQHPPSRVVIGPLPEGEDCQLRFAVGIRDDVWDASDGVTFRVSLRQGRKTRRLYKEYLDTRTSAPRWRERSVSLGTLDAASAPMLVLETGPGPDGDRNFDQAGWADPLVVCRERLRPSRANVLLISIDTLRADHLGVYGYGKPTSPNLDELAKSSLVFTRAYATAPWTLPSHASMFTGLLPHEHGAGHGSPYEPLSDEHPTLAAMLRSAGYRTVGFSAGGFAGQGFGLASGFERWVERSRVDFASVVPEILHEISSSLRGRPFFLFVHTFDVHGPYQGWEDQQRVAPAEWRSDDAATVPELPPEEWQGIRSIDQHEYLALERFAGLADVVDAYDAGIRQVDAQVGRILEHLRTTGLLDDTLVLVTSDHGESLYEDRFYIGHSYTVAEREIRVPLIVRLPGGAQRGRTDELVSLVDLVPLVLDALDMEPRTPMSGTSPLARLAGRLLPRHYVSGESVHLGIRFARSQHWKIQTEAWPPDDARSRLPASLADRFDPRARTLYLAPDGAVVEAGDPEPSHDGSGHELPVDRLAEILRQRPVPGSRIEEAEARAPSLDPKQLEELRALGYIQ
jgi:arylsulfatase A-like enzyme